MDTALDGLEGPSNTERPNGVPEEVRAHFDGCPACRGQWQLLTRAEAALRSPRLVPAPAGMLAEFRDRLAAETRHSERRPVNPFAKWLWPVGSLAAAGLAAAFVISMNIKPQLPTRPEPATLSAHNTAVPETEANSTVRQFEDRTGNVRAGKKELKIKSSPDRRRSAGIEPSGIPPVDGMIKASKDRAPGDRMAARPADGEARDLPELLGSGAPAPAPPTSEAARAKSAKDFASATVAPDSVAAASTLSATTQADKKTLRVERDRVAKKPADTQVANSAVVAESSPLMRGAQPGAAGAGFGGFGGGGGAAQAGAAGPAAPAALSKSDADARGLRQEKTDRLAILADLQAEKETQIAAEVSPALVTALQRPVTLTQRGPESVLTVLGRLSREADIEVQLEGKVSQLALSLQVPVKQLKKEEPLGEGLGANPGPQVPLWVALQSVAQQGKLQVVPEENRLVLRPLDAKVKAAPNPSLTRRLNRPPVTLQQDVRLQTAQTGAVVGKPVPGQQSTGKAAAPNEPRALQGAPAQNLYYFGYAGLPNPDPRVWPSMWGDLPKWLFTLPEERTEKAAASESK